MEEDRLAGHGNRPGKEEEVALSPHRENKGCRGRVLVEGEAPVLVPFSEVLPPKK